MRARCAFTEGNLACLSCQDQPSSTTNVNNSSGVVGGAGGVTARDVGGLQAEIARLRAQLQHTERVNAVLRRQLELNTESRFDPQLIVDLAQQIERLEAELLTARAEHGQGQSATCAPRRHSACPRAPQGRPNWVDIRLVLLSLFGLKDSTIHFAFCGGRNTHTKRTCTV